MGDYSQGIKLHEKAKELGISSKELTSVLAEAGYNYNSFNQILKEDALQYLFIEYNDDTIPKAIPDGIENAIIVPVGDKFAVIKILINSKLEVKEISRRMFDSKVRAYYELNYLNELLETGR